jgi:Ino eighty subunit 2
LENVDEENEEGEWDEGEDGAESEKKEEMKPTTMFRWVSRVVIEKVKLPGTTGADGMDVDAKEEEVKKMVLSFSVPESLLPVGSRDAKNEEAPPGKGGDAMEVDNDTSVLAAAPTPQHPATSTAAHTTQLPPLVPPAPQTCAIEGCREKRKYRWVKDWTVGACGMGHLKLLDSGAGRATVGV